ncbi:MAG TPA: YrzE family protein [Acidimicrobiales bacterium]
MALAHDAGFGALSFGSVIAGVLVAYGAFAVLAAIAGGVLTAMGVDSNDIARNDWRDLGIGSGIAVCAVLLVSYVFGGYVAGRMSRRAGALNGLFVFIVSLLVAAGVGTAVGMQTDGEAVADNLRSLGVPTSGEEWVAIGTIAGIAAVACMLLGAILGGMAGERWHGKLIARALDPSIGQDIDLRERDGRVSTLDEDRSETRDRTLVASGRRIDGDHFAGTDNGTTGVRDDTFDRDSRDGDVDWDGANRSRTFTDTSTTLDDDLGRHRK